MSKLIKIQNRLLNVVSEYSPILASTGLVFLYQSTKYDSTEKWMTILFVIAGVIQVLLAILLLVLKGP